MRQPSGPTATPVSFPIYASVSLVGVHALYVGDDLPNLLRGELVLPGRHSSRRAFSDSMEYFARFAAIKPARIGEVRTHSPGQVVAVAADTVHLGKQDVTSFRRVGASFEGIG